MMMVMVTSLGRVRGVEVVVGVVGVVQGRLPTYLGLIRRTTKTRKARCLNIRIIVIPIILEFHLTPQQPTPSSRLFSPSSSSSTCRSKAWSAQPLQIEQNSKKLFFQLSWPVHTRRHGGCGDCRPWLLRSWWTGLVMTMTLMMMMRMMDDADDDEKLACEGRVHDHLRARCLKMEKCQQRGKGMIRKSRHRWRDRWNIRGRIAQELYGRQAPGCPPADMIDNHLGCISFFIY